VCSFLLIFIFLTGILHAQWHPDSVPEYFKKRYLSEEEMHQPLRHPDFVETPPPSGISRMVAEYEPMQAVLVRYPLGIPYSLIREMAKDIEVITLVSNNSQANSVLASYESNNINTDNCTFLIAPTDSYWTRDYGPWFIFDGNDEPGIVDFPYNRPRPNDNNVIPKVAELLDVNLFGMNVIHTGGNMMADGYVFGASTDLVYDENSLSPTQIAEKFEDYLGITRYDVLNDPQGEYIKHIDCWGKYLAPDKILIGQVPASDPRYNDYEAVADYFANTPCAYGYPYKVYRVFMPGTYPPTPYSNSLILNNKVLVPISGSQHDNAALEAYQQAMPGYEIIGIQYNGWLDTDALHCRTHEIADIGMLYVNHMPKYGQLSWQDSIAIETGIKAYSGSGLIADSLLLYVSINGSPFVAKTLVNTESNNWQTYISGYDSYDTIRYYLTAADESGRSIKHPIMGAIDPHLFVMGEKEQHELTIYPDTLLFVEVLEAEFYIKNKTNTEVQIENISSSNEDLILMNFLPEFPYSLNKQDSLEIFVQITVPDYTLLSDGFVEEEIHIYSSLGDYVVYVRISEDLLTGTIEMENVRIVSLTPNPFTETVIFHVKPIKGNSSLTVMDINGRLVYQYQSATSSDIIWDGYGTNGEKLPQGMYFYHFRHDAGTQSGKLIRY